MSHSSITTPPQPRTRLGRRIVSALAAAWLLAGAWPAHAAMYQWTDADGSIGLTDDPGRIPEQYRASATPYQGSLPELTDTTASPDEPEPADASPTPGPAKRPLVPRSVPTPAPEAAANVQTDVNGHDEAWWRDRVQTLQRQQAAAKKERETAEQKYNELRYFGQETQSELKNQAELRRRMEELTDALKQIEQQLTRDLPEEARRAGAPAGWLR